MKKACTFGVFALWLMWGFSIGRAGDKAPRAVLDLTQSSLVQLGTDPIIVKAVKAENARRKTPAYIAALDERWQATWDITDHMQALMDSECGQHLRALRKSIRYYAEIFVTDNQGANVAMTNKTTDYWQGDEANFINCYQDGVGAGAIYISDVMYDKSTQTSVVQVSVPVQDEQRVIGVVVIGIDLDRLDHVN